MRDHDRLTPSICQQLTWLYIIKDHIESQQTATRAVSTPQARTYATQTETPYMSRETAEEWTSGMDNADGTRGAHWTLEQANKVQAQRHIIGSPVEFWAVLNSVYSDYYAVAKKHGVDTIGFYADLASAWLNDADANDGKASLYYQYVVRQ